MSEYRAISQFPISDRRRVEDEGWYQRNETWGGDSRKGSNPENKMSPYRIGNCSCSFESPRGTIGSHCEFFMVPGPPSWHAHTDAGRCFCCLTLSAWRICHQQARLGRGQTKSPSSWVLRVAADIWSFDTAAFNVFLLFVHSKWSLSFTEDVWSQHVVRCKNGTIKREGMAACIFTWPRRLLCKDKEKLIQLHLRLFISGWAVCVYIQLICL